MLHSCAPRASFFDMGRPHTIRSSGEFRRVFREGTRYAGRRANVYVLRRGAETRVGFVCGRGVGGAVERNRARRVLREGWRVLSSRVPEGFDLVFVAGPDIREAKTQEVVEELSGMLERAGVMEL